MPKTRPHPHTYNGPDCENAVDLSSIADAPHKTP